MKRTLRIYIDTSVIGGCLDDEFKDISRKLIEQIGKGEFQGVISDITELELMAAPRAVKEILESIPARNMERVELTKEASDLAAEYIREGVLDKNKVSDAQHIAVATVGRVDLVVSWNFRHIVNIRRIAGYNSVNLKAGYPMIDIRSPREVVTHEE
jgi:predicted nucleic acid-binding protein